jgi:sec-independent protein translocase protein TatC
MASDELEPGVNPPGGEVAPPDDAAPLTPHPDVESDDDDDPEEGMLRMSFLGHLEELRTRLLLTLGGIGVSFVLCLFFANQIWAWITRPIIGALASIGAEPNLVFTKPVDAFMMIWMKAPLLVALFLASPWVLYQVWAFIAPGLYKRERRWAAPFVICTAGLFVLGGAFAYYVAFTYALEFLLGFGKDINVKPMITLTDYFDLFVNVTLGVGLVFELPVLLFFLTLLRVVTPAFLMRNVRYAILGITVLAAIVTPTPDIFNLMMFAAPMYVLFFVGVFASYLLVLHREKQRFPWMKVLYGLFVVLAVVAAVVWLALTKYGYHLVQSWPFLVR